MKRISILIITLFIIIAISLDTCYSQKKFGFTCGIIWPKFHDSFIGENTAFGTNYTGYYHIMELGIFELIADLDLFFIKYSFEYVNPTIQSESTFTRMALNDVSISINGKYSFYPPTTDIYNYYIDGKIILHCLTSTVFIDDQEQKAESLPDYVKHYSYMSRIVPGMKIAFGLNQPWLSFFSVFAEFGFSAYFATGNFGIVPKCDGFIIIPEIRAGIKINIEK